MYSLMFGNPTLRFDLVLKLHVFLIDKEEISTIRSNRYNANILGYIHMNECWAEGGRLGINFEDE